MSTQHISREWPKFEDKMNSRTGLCSPKISLDILPWLACPSCALVGMYVHDHGLVNGHCLAWPGSGMSLAVALRGLGHDLARTWGLDVLGYTDHGSPWLILACLVPDSGRPITDPNAGFTPASGHLVSGQNGPGSRGSTDVDILQTRLICRPSCSPGA